MTYTYIFNIYIYSKTIATYIFPQADQQLFFFLSPLPPPDRGPENTERYCRLQVLKNNISYNS